MSITMGCIRQLIPDLTPAPPLHDVERGHGGEVVNRINRRMHPNHALFR
jgi:hypothetical protein